MQMEKFGSLMGGEGVMFCLALEWDGEDEVNPVAEVGAVVSGGRRVLMVVEVEVISVAGAGVVV